MTRRPLISVIHPTRRIEASAGFPQGWRSVYDAYRAACENPACVEYILVVHSSRWKQFWPSDFYNNADVRFWGRLRIVENTGRDCVVDQLNAGAKAATGVVLMGAMDDMYPPQDWDLKILEAMCGPRDSQGNFPGIGALDRETILVCGTGAGVERDRELMIAGAVTKNRVDRIGYLLDPDFESMFADNMYAYLARQDEKAGACVIADRMDIQFRHEHPILVTDKPIDETYEVQNRKDAYQSGYATFLRKTQGTRTLAVCMPGETFRKEIFASHLHLVCALNQGPRFLVQPLVFYSSNVHYTRQMMTQELNDAPAPWDYVLWVDDDNQLTPQQFDLLYRDLDEHPELAGVVGWCWCDPGNKADLKPQDWMMSVGRQGSWDDGLPCFRMTMQDFQRAAESGQYLIHSDDLAKEGHVFWSGFPAVLLRGETLRELGPMAFAPVHHPKVKFEYLSEDASFFHNAQKAGMKFACDIRVKVPHGKFRAIEPAYIPKSERDEALKATGQALPEGVTV